MMGRRSAAILLATAFAIGPAIPCGKPLAAQPRASSPDDALAAAIADRDLAGAKAALATGADPDKRWPDGKTPLIAAAESGSLAVVHVLIDGGASWSRLSTDSRESALSAALDGGRMDVARYLLGLGEADLPALFVAAQNGLLEWVQILGARGLDLAATDEGGRGFLAVTTSVEIATWLLDRKLDPNRPDLGGMTAVHAACRYGSLALVQLLTARGGRLDAPDSQGQTPLWHAMERKDQDDSVPSWLLDRGVGADPVSTDPWRTGYSPLWIATLELRLPLAMRLMAAGARVDTLVAVPRRDEFGEPLEAIFVGNLGRFIAMTKYMTKDGKLSVAEAKKAHYRLASLIEASWIACPGRPSKPVEAQAFILELHAKGAEWPIAARDDSGASLLHWGAAWMGREAVAALVAAGFDPRLRDKRGRTPFDAALSAGNLGGVEALARAAGESVSKRRGDGSTPLGLACASGSADLVVWLLERGADPNARSAGGAGVLESMAGSQPISEADLAAIVASLLDHGLSCGFDSSGASILESLARIEASDNRGRVSVPPLRSALLKAAAARAVVAGEGPVWGRSNAGSGAPRVRRIAPGAALTVLEVRPDRVDFLPGGEGKAISLPCNREYLGRFGDWVRVRTDDGEPEAWIPGSSVSSWFSAGVHGIGLLSSLPHYWLRLREDENGYCVPTTYGSVELTILAPWGTAEYPLPSVLVRTVGEEKKGAALAATILSARDLGQDRYELRLRYSGSEESTTATLAYRRTSGQLLWEEEGRGEAALFAATNRADAYPRKSRSYSMDD
jgi:uncharacterized protein